MDARRMAKAFRCRFLRCRDGGDICAGTRPGAAPLWPTDSVRTTVLVVDAPAWLRNTASSGTVCHADRLMSVGTAGAGRVEMVVSSASPGARGFTDWCGTPR